MSLEGWNLEIIEGRSRTKKVGVQYGSLGSSSNATMVLDESGVQKFHCVICADPNGIAIRDECKGGLKVNGNSVQKSLIKSGDVIEIGECKLRVQSQSAARQSAPLPQSEFATEDADSPPELEAPNDAEVYWFRRNGIKMGPVLLSTLKRLVAAQTLTLGDFVCADGATAWVPVSQAFGNSEISIAPPTAPPAQRSAASTVQSATPQTKGLPQRIPVWKRVPVIIAFLILAPVAYLSWLRWHESSNVHNEGSVESEDDMTFGNYFAAHSAGMSSEDSSATTFWLAEKGLLNKRMKSHPNEAADLRMQCSH